MAELLPYIFTAIVIAGLMYLAWRDGFEQGRSTATRDRLILKGRIIKLNETVVGLDNRMDGIEARLAKLERPDANVLYANDQPYGVEPDATFDGYKFRCEPEPDDICTSCTRQGTSICYGCGFDHVFYDKITEKPEDWNCDTCVNDGDMSHLQCRYCNEGSCYVKKEDTCHIEKDGNRIIVRGELPDDATECEVVKEGQSADAYSN